MPVTLTARLSPVALVAAVEGGGSPAERLAALRRLRGWLDSQEAVLAREVMAGSAFGEGAIAEASRSGLRQAERVVARAEVLEQLPVLAESLAVGAITAAHVDHVVGALRTLEPDEQRTFLDGLPPLAASAEHTPADRFACAVSAAVAQARRTTETERLARQVRDNRLSLRQDALTLQWRLSAVLDAATGARLHELVERAASRIEPGDLTPSDPIERASWRRAAALVQLVEHGSADRPVVVADHRGPTVVHDWGAANGIPPSLTEWLVAYANPMVIEIRPDGTPSSSQRLDWGRERRHATAAQRRALRALHPGCAVPGCTVPFHRCDAHHVIEWLVGGRTDLDNLLPLCAHHHTLAHAEGWRLTLTPDRTLTIAYPDGRCTSTGPPARLAA